MAQKQGSAQKSTVPIALPNASDATAHAAPARSAGSTRRHGSPHPQPRAKSSISAPIATAAPKLISMIVAHACAIA